MTPQLETVLEISAIGTALLFGALAGLIGLMYLLTGSWLFHRAAAPADDQDTLPVAELVIDDTRAEEQEELDRQHRAVAVAVALACAHSERPAVVAETPSDWRRMHRTRRLGQPSARASVRA